MGHLLPASLLPTPAPEVDGYEHYAGLRIDTTVNVPDASNMRWEDFSLITDYAAAHNFTPISDVLCLVNYAYRNANGSVGALIYAGMYVE